MSIILQGMGRSAADPTDEQQIEVVTAVSVQDEDPAVVSVPDFNIKQGEGKWLKFNITDAFTGLPREGLETATFRFGVKLRYSDAANLIDYDDTAFDKTGIESGIVRVKLLPADTRGLVARTHLGELMIDFGNNVIDKSETINIVVEPSVIT